VSEDEERPLSPRPKRKRIESFRALPLRSLVPNAVTLAALCAGLTSIRFSLHGFYEASVVAILIACFLDALDGRLARMLKSVSQFGAELDSLSDFVSFGVAPILLVYLWTLDGLGGLGWIVALPYSVACALRLARFNVMASEWGKSDWRANYFVGVPAPAAAGLILMPLYFSFLDDVTLRHLPLIAAVLVVLVSALMVSQVPTFSAKKLTVKIGREWLLPLFMGFAALVALALNYPWAALLGIGITYLALVPVSWWRFRKLQARESAD